MNNSIIKFKDCQLDEISGGITAKQIAKKTGAYAIKGTCSVVTGVFGAKIVGSVCNGFVFGGIGAYELIKNGVDLELSSMGNAKKMLKEHEQKFKKATRIVRKSEYITMPLFAVSGWKLGEYICQKIGLED